MLPKYWSGQRRVYLLRIDVFQLSIQDKFGAFGSQANGSLFAEENEREDIAVLEPRH